MLITRDIINKKIVFEDKDPMSSETISSRGYTYDDLCKKIDLYKNFLSNQNCKPGESVLIGYSPSLDQIALFFATCELGMAVIINDYMRADKFEDWNIVDTKTKIVGPINYFFHYGDDPKNPKQQFFNRNCDKCFSIDDVYKSSNFTPNLKILAKETDIVMRCTSSGSTGTPKKVFHTHEFMYNISKRNCMFFDGVVGLAFNLNHGSSIATYFIPSLMSIKVEKYINFNLVLDDDIQSHNSIKDRMKDMNHLMVPYFYFLETLLTEHSFPNLSYYTLSPVDPKFKSDINKNKFKDIISFFGCNETSGPIFINKLSSPNFRPERFETIDDHYTIIDNNPLKVLLKEYGTVVNTEDKFDINEDNSFEFRGKNNFIRINGEFIEKEIYDSIVSEFIEKDDSDMIYDTTRGRIYLAIWNDKYKKSLKEKIKKLNDSLLNITHHRHNISKVAILRKNDFVLGVKLDHELLRVYFREKVHFNDYI